MNNTIVNYEFEGSPISFERGAGIMVNATQMAKPFSKRPNDWLNLPSTKEFLKELTITKKNGNVDFQPVITKRGGIDPKSGGTWLHENAALEFARWLSPKFAIWCNDRIKELLTQGVATINNDDETIMAAIKILEKRIEESKARQKALEAENTQLQTTINEQAPKVEYHDAVLTSVSTYTTNQIAKEMGMSAITLNRRLHDMGVQYKQNGSWVLYAKYQAKGYTESETIKFTSKDGKVITKMGFRWTERGRKFIHETLKK